MTEKQHYIIGTAGHIDHGKTALIKALTGINTDRLKEEQERGITIELGFAYFENTDGERYGVVDVPGHEKFIPNMLAGVHGLDVVMMVVAADDGVKPQTLEHFEILHLLRIPRALFVITKTDIADEARIKEVREEIEILIDGSYLENSRIIPASARTGAGLDDVRAELARLIAEKVESINHPYFRFPIDRVFTIVGFGTVTTGTVVAGEVKIEDEVVLMPPAKKLRVRNIEVHDQNSDIAYSGQRTAINLTKVEKDEIERGMELISPQLSSQVFIRYYAEIETLPSKRARFKNFSRVRLFKGASETVVTLINLTDSKFEPKNKYIVDVSFREPALITSGDRFIIRDETNRFTLGGGEFILPSSIKQARMTQEHKQLLQSFSTDVLTDKLITSLQLSRTTALSLEELSVIFNRSEVEINNALSKRESELIRLKWKGKQVALKSKLNESKAKIIEQIEKYHSDNPELPGIPKQVIRDRMTRYFANPEEVENIWNILCTEGTVVDIGEFLKMKEFSVEFRGQDSEMQNRILELYSDFSQNPPKRERLPELLNSDKDYTFRILQGLLKSKELLMLKPEIYVARKAFEEIEQKTIEFLMKENEITIVQFKDIMNINRNLSVMLLELMDSRGVTLRRENIRVLRKKQ